MFAKKTIRNVQVKDKKVLVRVDFNVPLKEGRVSDDTRIQGALPTLRYLLEQGAAVVLMSHLGRPKGKVVPELSLRPVAEHLSQLLGQPVAFAPDCVGPEAQQAKAALKPGEVLLLENTRFHPEEKKNDPDFARQLAAGCDLFVNDAFGSAHRAHASTVGVAQYLPAVAGFLMEKELRYLGQALESPARPFVAILGGAKISDKIGVVRNLLGKADRVLIGGGMANTFLAALGYAMGDSLVEQEAIETAKTLLQDGSDKLLLPVDLVIAEAFAPDAQRRVAPVGDIPAGWRALDIGPDTVDAFAEVIREARTVVWNGPMGVFEMAPFAQGTFGIARAVAESDAVSIVGGGDSVAAVKQSGLADHITHLSTGGGASLEMLEGKMLPGVAALLDQ
ncbi:MAG TPA: phosphoglycerate kinase [Anaerolineae bacterium]|nr:phosphoglycerate kinase [Anaerolineae bacterium]